MNKHLYRIIFNEARGQLMVVGEHANNKAKAPGTTARQSRQVLGDRSSRFTGKLRSGLLLLTMNLIWHAPLQAQIISDTRAPGNQRPVVVDTPVGVPVVNIQTPSSAGVSRNQYSQFDVNRQGAILNNARDNVQTQLAGWVQGNAMLATGTARVILNEVNASNPSLLNGFVEVAGQRAEVVIANPAGLSCNGCGFINATRSTLTTGTPEFSEGQLTGYRVEQGTIRIDGRGMDDSRSDFTDIIARAVNLNAGVWANDLAVTTGRNRTDTQRRVVEELTASESTPDFALDVASLGGMYAGKITLKGTEEGVGVRNAGTIGASVGEVILTADGQLINSGKITANTQLSVTTTGALNNQEGVLAANKTVELSAAEIDNTEGTLASIDDSLTLNSNGQLANDRGRIESAGDLISESAGFSNRIGVILVENSDINTRKHQLDNTDGTIAVSGSLNLDTGELINHQGVLRATAKLAIDTHNQTLTNTGSGEQGGIFSQGSTQLTTGDLDNKGGFIGAGEHLAVTGQVIDNDDAGQILGEASVTIAGRAMENNNGSIQVKGDLEVDLAEALDNQNGLIRSGADIRLGSSNLNNHETQSDGKGIEGRNIYIAADSIDNQKGALKADQSLSIHGLGSINNTEGLISARGNLSIQELATQRATIQATRNLSLTNTRGTLISDRDLTLSSAGLSGDGLVLAQGDIHLDLQSDLMNTGTLQANGALSLSTQGKLTNEGQLLAGNTLSLTTDSLINQALGEISSQHTSVTANNQLTNRGLIDGGSTRLSAGTLNNIGTGRIYGEQIYINAREVINKDEGGEAAVIAARQGLNIGAETITNREHALIFSIDELTLGGALDDDGNVTGKAGAINNNSATMESLGSLSINTGVLNNTNEHFSTEFVETSRDQITEYQISGQSQRYAEEDISTYNDEVLHLVTPTGTRDNWNLYSYERVVKESRVRESDPGQLLAAGNVSITADTVLNDKSIILAGENLTGIVGSLTNTDVAGEKSISDSGSVTNYYRKKKKGRDSQRTSKSDYNPATVVQSISLSPTRYEGNATPSGSNTTLDERNTHTLAESAEGVTEVNSGQLPEPQVPSRNLLPNNSLFDLNLEPSATYLVQTDPRFTNQRQWLSSDFMLQQMQYDPATTQTRLGDGFYEQKLIREQVAQLTGQRFLEGYASDEAQYQQLMQAGVTYASEHELRPGVALSAEQVAQLTSDIVWLVEETVTLADGSQRRVLVPKVYMQVQDNDLQPTGSLLAGDNINLDLTGDLTNSGTIAGRTVTQVTADNIQNLGGRIRGEQVSLQARTDIDNVGGSIGAGRSLTLEASRDINSISTLGSSHSDQGSATYVDRIASVYVDANDNALLLASAGNDLNLIASHLSNLGADGETRLVAGNNLSLGTLNESSDLAITWDSDNWRKESQSRDIGSQINVTSDVHIQAGNNVTATAARVTSEQGAVNVTAGNNLTLNEGRATAFVDEAHKTTGSNGAFSNTTTKTRDTLHQDQSVGTAFSGNTINLQADNDLTLKGSSAVSTSGTTLQADNIVLEAATNTQQQQNLKVEKKSGLFSGGGIGFTIGSQQQTLDTDQQITSLTGSTVGSIEGDVRILANNDYRQTASDVSTPAGDIAVSAQNITIEAGTQTDQTVEKQSFKQSGLTVSVTSAITSALQTVDRMKELGSQTDNDRLTVLAGATAALAGKQAYDGINAVAQANTPTSAAEAAGVGISASMGASEQESTTRRTNQTAQQSTVIAGGDINLNASGAGTDSDIAIIGSELNAGNNATLNAEGDIHLQAAQNTAELETDSKGSSASVGIGFKFGGSQNGFSINAGVSGNRGTVDGEDISWQNTQVQAGNTVNLESGADTHLKGAVVRGEQVVAHVGGDLKVESLQDVSTYESEEKNAGVSVSVCVPPLCYGASSVSGHIGKTEIDSDYRSVTGQSGIKAGDRGFDITVAGHTDLKGGLIASNDQAIEDGVNQLTTGTLTTSDIENRAEYDASSISLGGGYSFGVGDQSSNPDLKPGEKPADIDSKASVTVPGVLAAKDDASSATESGISSGTVTIKNETKQQALTGKDGTTTVAELNRDVTSDSDSNRLDRIFDEQEIKTGFEITQGFVQEAGRYIESRSQEADSKNQKADKLKEQAMDPESGLSYDERMVLLDESRALRDEAAGIIAEWGAGSTKRQVSTALIAAAGGNVSGSLGAMGQTALVNYVQQQGAGYIGELVADGLVAEGSPEHAALHALVGCAGSGSSCASGATGAAAASLLTNLFTDPEPGESQVDQDNKKNLINSLVTGIAEASGLDSSAANSSSAAATDNNWLSSRQKVQYDKELEAAESLIDKLQVVGKWEGTSVRQDVITGGGIAAGLASSAVDDAIGLGEFLADPIGGLQGMKELITDPQVREQMTDQMFADLDAQIDRMSYALEHGGDEQAYQLGKDLGDLIWTVGSVVTGVGGVAKGGVKLARVGVDVGKKSLDVMGSAVRKAGNKVDSVREIASRVEVKVEPGTLGSMGGNIKVGLKPKSGAVDKTRTDFSAPQNSATTRTDLESTHGADNVRSTTVVSNPRQTVNSNPEKNIEVIRDSYGNKAVRVAYKDPSSGESKVANISYDSERGLPIFDDHSKYTTNIKKPDGYESMSSSARKSAEMRAATRDLRDKINTGAVDRNSFTPAQLKAINSGREAIPGYTWHHNAQSSPKNMQLLPNDVHNAAKHIGEASLSEGR